MFHNFLTSSTTPARASISLETSVPYSLTPTSPNLCRSKKNMISVAFFSIPTEVFFIVKQLQQLILFMGLPGSYVIDYLWNE